MTVGLVIVSHSSKIAEGVVELAEQMAPDIRIVPAGGTTDSPPRIGTSLEKVQAGLEEADQGDGVVVLTDLGSAVMTAEMTLEFLAPELRSRIRLPRAALVEGAVAAAVQAAGGGTVDDVASAAESAVVSIDPEALEPFVSHGAAVPGAVHTPVEEDLPPVTGSWKLPNKMGLHARPAAVIARALADLDAEVSVNGVDGKSVMLLMSLALGQGAELRAEATGPQAQEAIEYIGREVGAGFGEL
ncbi:HPr family phosphocarrier protein [Arthrobacter sp. JZ12]|uniref:dihydroxyacetone kinase phosphoryl donor subunit DhaM n=1 Tax=Arthrobacter sp. JZ12 TaxID=2654190 RepID=UPI002B48304C|nr:dihydroxyacetone kinase phosphoryl donor subunit DhaM [Arthrobacter sp. JZ12]WRH23760.1 HPr family phosphocarrier protein [Arthrobacter sp. JZ12]